MKIKIVDKKRFITFIFCTLLIVAGGIFSAVQLWKKHNVPITLHTELAKAAQTGDEVVKDFTALPLQVMEKKEESYEISDSKANGPTITVNKENAEAKNEESNQFVIDLPQDYAKPIEIKLDEQRSVQLTDLSGSNFTPRLLAGKEQTQAKEQKFPEQEKIEQIQNQFLQYQSKDKRKSVYYAYQRDIQKQQRKLKNWIVYQKGTGQEKEQYQIDNAKLKLNMRGELEGYYYSNQQLQNEQTRQDVGADLFERARIVLEKETGEDIANSNRTPDFIIPNPFYLDKNSSKHDLSWQLADDGKTFSVQISSSPEKYPLALDPTMQFTVPGQSSEGITIDGEVANESLGYSMTSGDFNADGKTDLVLANHLYGSGIGRVYIFYNDGGYSSNTAGADVIITGENSYMYFGVSLAAGDFNADGRTDLAVGADDDDYNAKPRVYIFNNDGTYPSAASSADSMIEATENGDFGFSLASGDFNADGRTDLVAGAILENSSSGRAYIFYNDGSIPTTTASADVIISGEGSSGTFGSAFAVGDFNADGRTDLAISASRYSSYTGRAYIFYNDGSIPTTASSADVIIVGQSTNNYFGNSLVSGDFNADGKIDLAMGAFGYSSNTGRVYIFYNDGSIPTTAATADVIITGGAVSDRFGFSIASGDFNADSRTDLAVGANGYSSYTGRAYIFYNDGSIPTTAATADVIITGETASSFGNSLAVGDFNADSKVDLAVGAPGYNANIGRVYVFYSENGFTDTAQKITGEEGFQPGFGFSMAVGDLDDDGKDDLIVGADRHSSNTGRAYIFYNDGSIPNFAEKADVMITGETTSNLFSTALATGDFNYDGRDDLAVGARAASSNAGRAYIFYGDGSFPSAASAADVIIVGEASSYFGISFAAGDFNSDNKTDLAVGAYINGLSSGRAYIFYNDGSIPATAASADVIITGEASSYFGYAMQAGDFNDDSATDLAIGAYYYSSNIGRTYIFYNDGSIPTTAATADVTITGEALGYFGSAFAAGDFDYDGDEDLAVGAYGFNGCRGKIYIFYNDGSIPTAAASADFIITGQSASSYFASALVVGDFNYDGRIDLAANAYPYASAMGRIHVFYNDGSMPTTDSASDLIISGEAASNYFGQSFAAGDFNNDGRTDLAVGANMYNTYIGKAYIFYNDGSIPTSANDADVTITGQSVGYFGYAMEAGDFNFDGKIDLSVGAYYYNGNTGRVYIFYNNNSFPEEAFSADVVITGEDVGGYFGYSLEAGDFNADGKEDLAVGANRYGSNSGRVYIFHSDGSFPESASSADVMIDGQSGSYFGTAMTSEDFNSDNKTDLVVGAYYYNSYMGRAYLFYNDGTIPTAAASADLIINGEANSYFSDTMNVGDLDGDGKKDLIIGAYRYSAYAGRVYIFYNDGSISTSASTADFIITGDAGGYFGQEIEVVDLDADNKKDLLVSSLMYGSSAGRVYVFFNDGSMPTTAATADFTITGESSSRFGQSIAAGDFNADGREDLAVGSSYYSAYAGRVYIFYNDGSIPTTAATADAIFTGEASSYFSQSLIATNFNADAGDDLAAGAYGYSSSSGVVYFFISGIPQPDMKIQGDFEMQGDFQFN